jgi:hypothetical protein
VKLKVVQNQNTVKFKNMIVSGVVAVQCHHGLYVPGGMVDPEHGEG